MKSTMKKALSLILALVMVMALVACGGEGSEPAGDSGETKLKAAMLMDGPADDGGWNADCYDGIMRIQDELGYEIAYSENVKQADFVSATREYAAAGYDLIILTGNQFQDAAKEVYEEFPDVHFAGINFEFTAPNVSSLTVDSVQFGFLGGALAALVTETKNVGFIGGTEIWSIIAGEAGMRQGAAYIDPEVTVTSSMTGSWSDVAKGKEMALAQISTSNVDTIFGFASACNIGMLEACKEEGKAFISQPVDITATEPDVIASSVLCKNSQLMVSIAEMVSLGLEEGQALWGDASNGALAYGEFGSIVSAEDQAKLEEIVAGLSDGSIVVEPVE